MLYRNKNAIFEALEVIHRSSEWRKIKYISLFLWGFEIFEVKFCETLPRHIPLF